MAKDKKAQGTIEYLVIIAIVVVIALVVVGLLIQLSSPAKGVGENNAKITWKTATPFSIVDWTNASSADGNITIVLQNSSDSALDFVDMNIGIKDYRTTTNVDINNIAQGSKQSIVIKMGTCTAGSTSSYAYAKDTIKIYYRTPSISSTRTETAMADIVGACN